MPDDWPLEWTEPQYDDDLFNATIDAVAPLGPAVTSLCEAVRRNDEGSVQEMSDGMEGKSLWDPKREAVLAGKTQILAILLDADDGIDKELVTVAYERKDRNVIDVLLKYGWSINRPLRMGSLTLWYSVDDLEFMRWLIAKGADITARSEFDESTLSVAIKTGSMDAVRFLLRHEKDVTRGNLIHRAAQRTDQNEGAALVEELLMPGADINSYQYNNNVALWKRFQSKLPTPLHIVSYRRNIPVARTLLRFGADPHCKMLQEFREVEPSPMAIAIEHGVQELVDLFAAADFSRAKI